MDSYAKKTNNLRKTNTASLLSRPFVPDSRSKRLVTTKNQFPGGSLGGPPRIAGFDVVNDLSGCSLAALNGIPTFKKITNHLVNNEVGKIVRVIDERKLVFRQLLNLAAKMRGYQTTYVTSLEEAEQELFNAQKQDGLRFCLLDQPVAYIVDGKEGKGEISDISVSGCAIKHDSLSPTMNEFISFSTTFQKRENLLKVFETEAKVVWVENNKFAVSFQKVDNDLREQMAERLVYESKSELN